MNARVVGCRRGRGRSGATGGPLRRTLERRVLVRLLWILLVAWMVLPGSAFAQGVGSFVSPGPLARPHAELDSITQCNACHTPGFGPSADRCMNCHDEIKLQVTSRKGFHSDKGKACEGCHPDHRGRDFQLVQLEESDFDHDTTGFPLKGEHARTRCISCHTTPNDYGGLSPVCSSCHDDPHGASSSKRQVLRNCDNCHDAEDWDALPLPTSVFDHTSRADTDYLLEGLHLEVRCESCHFESRFVPIEHSKCTSCHSNPHKSDFKGESCESCHPSAKTWEVADFDHDRTRYKIRGEHRKVSCDECHTSGDKTAPLTFSRCDGCHEDIHSGQFRPRPCDECHTVNVARFALRDWDHDKTDYPLVGQHREQDCEECHKDGAQAVYANLPHADCDDCHEDAHDGRFEPTNCALCHIPDGFQVQAFDHDQTNFPHTGKHVGLDCNKCHRDFQWNGIPHESCVDCHYTKNPHRPVITADQCDDCHVTDGFDTIRFDHLAATGFDLEPAHDDAKCTSCHTYIYHFAGLDPSCTGCHLDDRPFGHYDGECGACHEAAHWFPGGLGGRDHDVTGFALHGSHELLPCESCHPPGAPRGEATPQCSACHWSDDPHMNLLGTACADCHGEMSWLRTTFRHSSTGWPLRGAHRLAACVDCHATGYIGTPTDCVTCHEAEAPLVIPAHLTPAFPVCDTCHRSYTWQVPNYPH